MNCLFLIVIAKKKKNTKQIQKPRTEPKRKYQASSNGDYPDILGTIVSMVTGYTAAPVNCWGSSAIIFILQ